MTDTSKRVCPKCGAGLTYLTNMDDGSTITSFACGSVHTANMYGGYGDSLSQHADCVTAQIAQLTRANAELAGIVRAFAESACPIRDHFGGVQDIDTDVYEAFVRAHWKSAAWVAEHPEESQERTE